MAAATTIALIGLGVASVGMVGQAVYASQAASASRRAEKIREQQMRLDAMRRRRESIRQAILASSMSRARGTAQGVYQGSSVYSGAEGQTLGELGRQLAYTNASETLGAALFGANADYAQATGMSQLFGSIGSMGNMILSNAQPIRQIGMTLFGLPNPWTTTVTQNGAPPASTAPQMPPIHVPIG